MFRYERVTSTGKFTIVAKIVFLLKKIYKGDDLCRAVFKVLMTRIFFISLFERAFKMMKNGVYFIVIALLVAELFKILVYAN